MIRILMALVWVTAAQAADEYVFDGKDPKGKECEVRVVKTSYAGNTGKWVDLRADIDTSFVHGTESAGEIEVRPVKDKPQLFGKSKEGSELTLNLKEPENLESATNLYLRFKHHNHFDIFQCKGLSLRKPKP